MNLDDTIVAISSPAGAGERAVLRLSGPRAVEIAEQMFAADDAPDGRRGLAGQPTYTMCIGRFEPPGADLSVPATAYLMRAPRSYTRQDVVEFHVGAWPALEGVLLAHLAAAGARPAEPGEFTFRALMNGRLDLAQAEAVMSVISASSETALRAAGDLLAGHLSQEVARLSAGIVEVLAQVEAGLDFSDQDIVIATPEEIAARIDFLRRDLADLGRRSRGLETFSGNVRLVVVGRPNAGKSSLFNGLLAADRAIVSPEAGTTRDELRAALHVDGLTFTLCDTAGVREHGAAPLPESPEYLFRVSDAGVPRPGLPGDSSTCPAVRRSDGAAPFPGDDLCAKAEAKAVEAVGGADLVLLALDATATEYDQADELLALVAAPVVVAVTKADLAPPDRAVAWLASRGMMCAGDRPAAPAAGQGACAEVVVTSAVTGEGISALRSALVRAVAGGAVDRTAAGPVVTARHRAALEESAKALARAARVVRRDGEAGELAALELREALAALGSIIRTDADVLGAVFSRFCIGK